MKISVLAPWLCACALLVAVVFLFRSNQRKDAELASARGSVLQAEQMRQALKQLETTSSTQSNQLTELRVQQGDLMRLRNEVRQLRLQNQELAKQVQTAQSEAQRAQVQVQTAQSEAQRAQAQANQLADAQAQRKAARDRQAEYESRVKAVVDANGGLGTPQGQAACRLHQQLASD
jgi:hypothetical protein